MHARTLAPRPNPLQASRHKIAVNPVEFRDAMKDLGVEDLYEMARVLRCHPSTISRILGGEHPISVNMIVQFTALWGACRTHKICDDFRQRVAA